MLNGEPIKPPHINCVEDYSKPFYMDNRMRQRIYGRDWDKVNPYLPALEPKADDTTSVNSIFYLDKNMVPGYPGTRGGEWYPGRGMVPGEGRGTIDADKFGQLQDLVLYLQRKLNEHIDKSKKRKETRF